MAKAKAIMIQGTMSNAGKSLLTAGLCRIFYQDGYRVAPFKSQNMALNSFITEEGLEMGRAQAVQAEAAKVKPTADMNPILLKPTTDVGSQVIVHGIHRGNMSAREYFAYKQELIPEIMTSYHQLEAEYDIIVIEGAGSPAEINLKSEDIVNMGMAKLADAPVLLVGDIDRGGVFAQLYGTVMLLEEEERERIKGLIINKFRGDKTILDSGVTMIEALCRIPSVGVVPCLHVDLEDEDSLSDKINSSGSHSPVKGLVDIAVIRLPRISNFTDFHVLSVMEQVTLRYVSEVKEFGRPDLVILPGTKSTIEDLLWLRQCGLEAAVLKLASQRVPVFGICGGYQMLGRTLTDEGRVEARAGHEQVRGMGLLPIDTVYGDEKTKTRVTGSFAQVSGIFEGLSGKLIEGYEIHMGRSERCKVTDQNPEDASMPLTYLTGLLPESKQFQTDGVTYGNIYGTYVHGIFDSPGITEQVVNALLKKKGFDSLALGVMDYGAYKEKQYDTLAAELRKHLDMEQIYRILGLSPDQKEEIYEETGAGASDRH